MEFVNGGTGVVGGAQARNQIIDVGRGIIEVIMRLVRCARRSVEVVSYDVGLHAGRRWLGSLYRG